MASGDLNYLNPIIYKFAQVREYIVYFSGQASEDVVDRALSKLDKCSITRRAMACFRKTEREIHDERETKPRERSKLARLAGFGDELDSYEEELRRTAIARIEATPIHIIANAWLHEANDELRKEQEAECEAWEKKTRKSGTKEHRQKCCTVM